MKGNAMTQHNYKRLVTQVANVFATYKVDPHDEGAPVQDVVDHLTRCIAHLLPQDEQAWFVTASRLQEPLWRFDHEAHAAGIDAKCDEFRQEMTD
tara:strand:+ start:682 stop:966 length:285 start_codon:yes stop_codon:yes gene_type:complete